VSRFIERHPEWALITIIAIAVLLWRPMGLFGRRV